MKSQDFFLALDDLEREKHIKKETFIDALQTALVIAYKKHTGDAKAVEVKLDPEKYTIDIIAYLEVVEEVTNSDTQISLEDARLIDKKYKIGDKVAEKVVAKDFGRIAAQTAKQVIMQKLREVESELAYNELSQKEGELITCVVRRIDGKNVYVEINKLEALLMPQDQAPNDHFNVGDRVKVYVKKIKVGTHGPQITVSRTVAGFVKRLFEIEVPEIAAGLVTIKAIVREAGYRTKMAVYCEDGSIDPVGACVGNRGMRVNAIVSELGGEKIDIIPWHNDALEFIARALSPAKVTMVEVNDDDHSARAIVDDNMLSLAIGKDGQNARLAARLTGWKIDVKSYSNYLKSQIDEDAVRKTENFETIKDSEQPEEPEDFGELGDLEEPVLPGDN